MNILSLLKKLEDEISEYADIAGKDAEEVCEEIRGFIVGKKVEAANNAAASSGSPATGNTTDGAAA